MEPCPLRSVLGGILKDIQGTTISEDVLPTLGSKPSPSWGPPCAVATGRGKGLGAERVWQAYIVESRVGCSVLNTQFCYVISKTRGAQKSQARHEGFMVSRVGWNVIREVEI